MKLPNISSYGDYQSQGYGAHTLCVEVGDLAIYFSYKTPVAFRFPGIGLVVRQNSFSRTTGRHLNMIDGGSRDDRVDGDVFEEALRLVMDGRIEDAKLVLDTEHRLVHKALTGRSV